MVVDLAVENDNRIAILRAHGLIAAAQVNNLEPHRAHGNIGAFMRALLIGAPVDNALHRALQHASGRFSPEMGETCYTAHMKQTRIKD